MMFLCQVTVWAAVLLLPLLRFSHSFHITPRILCCSSESTACLVRSEFDNVHHVHSTEEAEKVLSRHPDDAFSAILVDEKTWDEQLFHHCRRLLPARLVVCSSSSQEEAQYYHHEHYYTNGADAVVATMKELVEAHSVLIQQQQQEESFLSRQERQEALQSLANGALTVRVQQLHSHTQRYQRQRASIRQSLSPTSIRVVHISDTHNYHHYLKLPEGDLLLHTGDICGNYRDGETKNSMPVLDQFQSFLNWLAETACPKYDHVVFIAGNHDTYLDKSQADEESYEQAQTLLQNFLQDHSKVTYLQDSSTLLYNGRLHIYGTPTSICRVEAHDRHMLSNAFERTIEKRQEDWNQIPRTTDILMTHLPPAGMGLSQQEHSCPLMTDTVYKKYYSDDDDDSSKTPPKLHAFGHVHSQFGIGQYDAAGDASGSTTILSNASQERLLRVDLYGGGLPIVHNVEI